MTEQLDEGVHAAPQTSAGGTRRVGAGGRHRPHVFLGRGHVVKVRYADEEQSTIAPAAELTGLRPSGFVASAALLFARGLLQSGEVPVEDPTASQAAPGLGGRPVVVAWSAGEDQELLAELLAELVQVRLALRRYGVNVNQAVAALNSGGQAPVWLEQAVAGSDRAVARVDEATAALTRRLS